MLRQTDPSPPKTRHRCAFYSQFSTNICGGATTSFSRARCRATMTPFSYDRVLYSARTRSGDARAHTDVTRTRSVSLALSLVARALRLNGTLTHSHTHDQQHHSNNNNSGSDTTHDSRPTSTAVVCADATGARRVRVWCV